MAIDAELERNSNAFMSHPSLQPMGMTISAHRWYGAPYDEPTGGSEEPSPSPNETTEPMTADERLASITRLLAMNQALGYNQYPCIVDIADAYTRFPHETNSTNLNEENENDTVESMPSLEPRDDEEEEDDCVSTTETKEDVIPLNLPEDDDDPEVPMPVTELAENEEEESHDPYEAPPVDVDITESESISILKVQKKLTLNGPLCPLPKPNRSTHGHQSREEVLYARAPP